MIDIHSHILPEIDDGAGSLDAAITMAMMAVSSGVQAIVATPHCNIPLSYQNYYTQALLEHFFAYQDVLKSEKIPLQLFLGMEIFGTEQVPKMLADKRVIPLNNSRYPLIEFDFGEDPDLVEWILDEVRKQGFTPVIAHPERYSFVQKRPELVWEWIQKGYLTQVNKDSILGNFGNKIYELAHLLLEHRWVSCVASDAHGFGFRTTSMDGVRNRLLEQYPAGFVKELMLQNPYKILANKPVKMKPAMLAQ